MKNHDRRTILKSLIGGAAAARLAPLVPSAAHAAGTGAPQRLLLVFHPMGYFEPTYWPTRTPDGDWKLGETMTALADRKSKLIFLDGLLNSAMASWVRKIMMDNEHGWGIQAAFTGSHVAAKGAGGPSIDQVVAASLAAKFPTRYRSLAFSHSTGNAWAHSRAFYAAAEVPVNGTDSAKAVYDSLFKDLVPTGGAMGDNGALARLRRNKQSVIDMVRADLKRACDRIGVAEKDMCQAHLDGVRQIEKRLGIAAQPLAMGCSKPVAPAGSLPVITNVETQMDLITSTFACDLTRVATLQLGNADGFDVIAGLNHHGTTHAVGDTKGKDPEKIATHQKFDRWFADRWAYLLRRLDGVGEGNGTLLDNTLVMFASDTSTRMAGDRIGAHDHSRFPFWLAGGGNFAFKTGRYLVYDHPDRPGPPDKTGRKWPLHNALLVSIGRAFGLDMNAFGTHDDGSGPLAQV